MTAQPLRARLVTILRRPNAPWSRRGWVLGAAAAAIVWGVLGLAWAGTGYVYRPAAEAVAVSDRAPAAESRDEAALKKARAGLRRRDRDLRASLARTTPRGPYIVIDRTHNTLSLKKGEDTVLLAVCSAGSGATLKDPGGNQEWVFSTPRGRFKVLSRLANPVWRKPDWAFVEEGLPIPTDPGDRFEYGALGEYALNFGDGYLIHGTLYERLLGRSVSHGCVRLGRDDLRQLYAAAQVGTPIYIY